MIENKMPRQSSDDGLVSNSEEVKVSFGYENIDLSKISLRKIDKDKEKLVYSADLFKNLDEYETEKITDSLGEVKRLADTMQRYLDKMKELESNDITIAGTHHSFDKLRFPGALFGPGGEFSKLQNLQVQMALILDKINTLEKTQ